MNNLIIHESKSWIWLKAYLLVSVFYSLHSWPFLGVDSMSMQILLFICSVFFFFKRKYWNFSSVRMRIVILLILLNMYVAGLGNINLYIFSIMGTLPSASLILLKDEYLLDLFESFQKILYPILGFGSIFWIFHLFGYDLPSSELTYGTLEQNGVLVNQYNFSNHYLYLVDNNWFALRDSDVPSFFRFCSIFLEPGYLGIIMMFLLFINNFDLKQRRNQVYLLSLILTLSLAGFLLTTLAFIAHKMQSSSKRISVLVGVFLLLMACNLFFSNYNNGNNVVNEAIISRLQLDEEKGISGNNRTSEAMDEQYKSFLTSTDVVFGVHDRTLLEFGVGYKAYVIKNGLFGLGCFILFLLWIAKLGSNFKSWILMILYLLMFSRGEASMFWSACIMIYMSGVIISKSQNCLENA